MALKHSADRQAGWRATEFRLPGVDGRTWSLSDVTGRNGVVVMFICNHCPYVQAVVDRMVRDVTTLAADGIGAIAICSNDPVAYPEDAPDRMAVFARDHGFTFPYVFDETQEVARTYGAVCTPDFFGFNAGLELQYRGRLDAAGPASGPDGGARELLEAMRLVARSGHGPDVQHPSMGCSIKWRAAA